MNKEKSRLREATKVLAVIGSVMTGLFLVMAFLVTGLLSGWIDSYKSVPNPLFLSHTSKALLNAEQHEIPSTERDSWPTYSDPDVGITVHYPPHLRPFETAGGQGAMSWVNNRPVGGRDTFYSTHFMVAADKLGDTTWYYGGSPHDRFIVRVEDKPFSLNNVSKIGRFVFFDRFTIRWWYPKKIILADRGGYYIPFFDTTFTPCGSEHYAFPNKDGQKIVKLSFIACPQNGENQDKVMPYKNAILSSVQWTQ